MDEHRDHDHDHDHDHPLDSHNDVLTAKAVTMVVLCTVSTIMGIIPIFLAKWFKWDLNGQNPRYVNITL